jgi:hypothetical protein
VTWIGPVSGRADPNRSIGTERRQIEEHNVEFTPLIGVKNTIESATQSEEENLVGIGQSGMRLGEKREERRWRSPRRVIAASATGIGEMGPKNEVTDQAIANISEDDDGVDIETKNEMLGGLRQSLRLLSWTTVEMAEGCTRNYVKCFGWKVTVDRFGDLVPGWREKEAKKSEERRWQGA